MQKIKKKAKEFIMQLPPVKRRHDRYIQTLCATYDKNRPTPSILSVNCAGGIISHYLGLRFLSPTVNLWIDSRDFVKFACNLKAYLEHELMPVAQAEYPYPVGKLDDILIYFNHYKDFDEAKRKWDDRKTRIDYDNLYIIADDISLNEDQMEALEQIACKRLVWFSAKERPNYHRSFWLKQYAQEGKLGLYSVKSLGGYTGFEKEFHFAKWLNGDKDFRI